MRFLHVGVARERKVHLGFAHRSSNVLVVSQLGRSLGEADSMLSESRLLVVCFGGALAALAQSSVGERLDATLVLSNFRHNALSVDPRNPRESDDSGTAKPPAIDDPRPNVRVLAGLLAAVRQPS